MKKHPGCPFCLENGKVNVIAQVRGAYLISALDEAGHMMPGCYFIIPKRHVENQRELPNNWQKSKTELLAQIPAIAAGEHYNSSLNQGRAAGQRIAHVHEWVIIRSEEVERYLPSHELGLAALIKKVNERR